MIEVLDPGPQCTVQADQRTGLRHAGVPMCGPADPLAAALANRLVGNRTGAACLEIAFGPASFRFTAGTWLGICGAPASLSIGSAAAAMHETLRIEAGQVVEIGAAPAGARLYLAVAGAVQAETFLGSVSTYLPAGFGGHAGRALRRGDVLGFGASAEVSMTRTPEDLRAAPGRSHALRAVAGPDLSIDLTAFSGAGFHATARQSRMGIEIEGAFPDIPFTDRRPSSAIFPGGLQVTPEGRGFLLLPDGQTTGGYPHLLQVIRADRHLLGQVRPGDRIEFLIRTPAQAKRALTAKQAILNAWLPGFWL